MGKKSGPPAPDYTAAAEKQAQSSKEVTNMQTWANRPDLQTPWGSQTWSPQETIDPATGQKVTKWSSQINLSPDQQQALDSQMGVQQKVSQGADSLANQAVQNFQNPMDWGGMSPGGQNVQAGQVQRSLPRTVGDYRQTAQDAVWNLQKPMMDQRRAAAETQLANQGITRGSEAWQNAQRELGDAEARAQLQAIESGRGEAAQMFGQDLSAGQFGNTAIGQQLGLDVQANAFNNQNRQQDISEETMRRGQTLNELNALLYGQQVQNPQMPNFTNASAAMPTNYMGAAQNQYQAAMDKHNAKQAGIGGAMGGLFDLGSAAMGAGGWGGLFALSDERLKRDIKLEGTLPNGLNFYSYRFIGSAKRVLGVMAQEVLKVMPDAVAVHPSGFYMVNYSKVMA